MIVKAINSGSSWLDIATDSDFSLRNIPFGVFSPCDNPRPRCGTAIGSSVVDLSVLAEAGLLDGTGLSAPSHVFCQETLNEFISCPRQTWINVRNRIIDLFATDGRDDLRTNHALRETALYQMDEISTHLPVAIGDYTDFYSSREHATNVGTMFRGKDNALQPNWLHLPVGYHGRASSVFPTGTPVHRPSGQLQKDKDDQTQGSTFGPSRLMDFELEMAFFVGGPANQAGYRLDISEAKNRIFGFVLMNDWSARDIQKWEYVPLGPFTSKNFATTVSSWIVTTMALEEFTCTTSAKEQTDPLPLEYIQDPSYSSYNINLDVAIMADGMSHGETVCKSNFANLYWNAAQQLVHHSVTGCVMKPGDLLASGTISGSDVAAFGSMLELSWRGSREVPLGTTGQVRKFLKDGDTVIMTGWCEKEGYGRVGFGECSGKILPPVALGEKPLVEREKDTNTYGGRYKDFKLYSFWKSSSSWRVRIALEAKGIAYENIPIDMVKQENQSDDYVKRNPMSQVPVLEFTDTVNNTCVQLSQSIAIIEFLEESITIGSKLLPVDPVDRAVARQASEIINAGTQPLQNLPFLKKIETMSEGKIQGLKFGASNIRKGLVALEKILATRRAGMANKGPFALGGFCPTVVDICLIPQLYNARYQGADVEDLHTLLDIEKACEQHPFFVPAHPAKQPDAPAQSD